MRYSKRALGVLSLLMTATLFFSTAPIIASNTASGGTPAAPQSGTARLIASGPIDTFTAPRPQISDFLVFDSVPVNFMATSMMPRTFMGQGFNASNPGGPLQITKIDLFMVSYTAQTYTDIHVNVQFWDTFDAAGTVVFSSPVPASPLVFDLGNLTTAATPAVYAFTASLASPITLTGLNNHGIAINYQGNTGSGLANTNNLSSPYYNDGTPIPVGSRASAGYYRNASGHTDFNFVPSDIRSPNANSTLAFRLYANSPLTATPSNTPTNTAAPTHTPTATSTPTNTPTSGTQISIVNFAFVPQTVTIPIGTTVTWTNNDGATHTTTSDTNVWDSGALTTGQTFSFTFNTAGVYPYHCSLHPGMTGTITVTGPTNTPTQTTTPSLTSTFTLTPTSTQTLAATQTPTSTNTPVAPRPDTIGVFFNGVFYLRNSNSAGPADITAIFGGATMLPVKGDWNGDGMDSIGVYDGSTGVFYLSDSNTTPAVNYQFVLGNPGDTPLSGKWDNTISHDGAGVFRPSNGLIYVKRALVTGFADYTMVLGNPGDSAVAGDWDGNGFDSIGVFRPSQTRFYLSNTITNGIVFGDFSFIYGTVTSKPVSGDWTGSGVSHIGVFLNGTFFLRNSFTTGPADAQFLFGPANALPIAGKWTASSAPGGVVVVGSGGGIPSTAAPSLTPAAGEPGSKFD